jgi:sugar-phosphatase
MCAITGARPEAEAAATVTAAALLLDLDGTLVDTTAAVEASWRALASRLDVPWERFSPYIHGIPAEQALARVVPTLSRRDVERLAAELLADQAGRKLPVIALPGAIALTDGLAGLPWAVVTSATRRSALSNMGKAGLPTPEVLITADDVSIGKPDPEPYLRAAELLGVAARDCVVLEDAPAGITSARATGATVIAVTTTYPRHELTEADWIVSGVAAVTVSGAAGGIGLKLRPECQP